MYFRTKALKSGSGHREYLQLVEGRREGARVLQHVIARLGRLDLLRQDGTLLKLAAQLARLCPTHRLTPIESSGSVPVGRGQLYGPLLLLEKRWEQAGMPQKLAKLAEDFNCSYHLERAAMSLVAQVLLSRQNEPIPPWDWVQQARGERFTVLARRDFEETLGFLGKHSQGPSPEPPALPTPAGPLPRAVLSLSRWTNTQRFKTGTEHYPWLFGTVLAESGAALGNGLWLNQKSGGHLLWDDLDALRDQYHLASLVVVCPDRTFTPTQRKALRGHNEIVLIEEIALEKARRKFPQVATAWLPGRTAQLHRQRVEDDDATLVLDCDDSVDRDRAAEPEPYAAQSSAKQEQTEPQTVVGQIGSQPQRAGCRVLRFSSQSPSDDLFRLYEYHKELQAWHVLAWQVLRPLLRQKRSARTGDMLGAIAGWLAVLRLASMTCRPAESAAQQPPAGRFQAGLEAVCVVRAVEVAFGRQRYLLCRPLSPAQAAVFQECGLPPPPPALLLG
ncbi:MAG: hypothetical protein JNM56_19975 [Planctomycetia bacterium]|nr:hypothetical protein [Planctomycetia bacterium]